jgi:hypothetical protein
VVTRGCRIWHRLPRETLSRDHQPFRRYSAQQYGPSIKRTRNIGIIAHIDAVRYILDVPSVVDIITNNYVGENNYHGAYALLQWLHPSNRRYAWL